MKTLSTETMAKLAVGYSGLAWGLFWLPLRALQTAGFTGVWTLVVFYCLPAALALPWFIGRWRHNVSGGIWLPIIGLTSALSVILYSAAVLNTEVIRAMMLFYLSPVWSMLMARLVLGERMSLVRWLAVALAFAGMAFILKGDAGLPLPRNIGDWMALSAGFLWSASTVLLRTHEGLAPVDLFHQNLFWSAVLTLPMLILLEPAAAPALSLFLAQLWWLVPTMLAVMMTGVYASMWGAPKLSPAIVGILYMTEIVAGSISAAIWAGEPFGPREITGIALITLAASLESLRDYYRSTFRLANR